MPNRLLILDDDPDVAHTLQMIAEGAGLDVRSCHLPDAFFTELTDWNPTHIALDLVMPDMDGVEVMGELATLGCDARIIISSGVAGRVLESAERAALEHGLKIIGVLSKPFSATRFRALLCADPANARAADAQPIAGQRIPPSHAPSVSAADLRSAIEHRGLTMAYQPKIRCATRELCGFEALTRWTHPTYGVIGPTDFIPLAERNDLIDALTDSVLEMSLEWFSRLAGRTELTIAINLSAHTASATPVKDPGGATGGAFVERTTKRCTQYNVDPSKVVFELTESSAMEDPVASLDLLTRLRMKGYQLAIDDFGTGYSSMVQLVRLPFTEIKIDRSFVHSALISAESRAVVQSIVQLGKSLGLTTVAEGVEDGATLTFLSEIGCDAAQGYHISRPLDGPTATRWLARHSYELGAP